MSGSVKQITTCAVMTALLIVLQFVLSPVAGVELVTVFLLCFCTVYGAKTGCITATAFSLLRCLLFGFSPNVLILYLVYYNLFALLFGTLKDGGYLKWICLFLLGGLLLTCGHFAAVGVPVSILLQRRLRVLLWVLFGLLCALFFSFIVLLIFARGREGRRLASIVALAAFCTVCFTLLDDILTPLFYGYSREAALAYFYASLLTLVSQTVCTVVSVGLLFFPLEKTFLQTAKWLRK